MKTINTNGEDVIVFDNEEDFIKYLRDCPQKPSEDYIKETVEHERAHLQMAISLGYDAKYSIRIVDEFEKYPTIYISDKEISKKDLVKIIMAPKIPSKNDVRNLEMLNKK